MEWPLLVAGLALGIAATPHCAVMCGAPCASLTRGSGRSASGFHAGRLIGYMAAGAVAAGSVELLGRWGQASPALRPLWTLLHLAFVALGLWWLATGRQPAWLARRSKGVETIHLHGSIGRPLRAGAAGLAWVAWPCAALQGALLTAALANDAVGGAFVMATFAIASAPGLAAAPWVWERWRVWRGPKAAGGDVAATGFRVAGFGLIVVAGWALTHGIWQRVAAWCAA